MFPLTKTAGLAISQSHARVLCVCVCVVLFLCVGGKQGQENRICFFVVKLDSDLFFFFFFLLGSIFVVWPASYVPYVLV